MGKVSEKDNSNTEHIFMSQCRYTTQMQIQIQIQCKSPGHRAGDVDSIAVSVFVVILVEFESETSRLVYVFHLMWNNFLLYCYLQI